MSIVLRKCDRCGKEIKDTDWGGRYDYTVTYVRYTLNVSRSTVPDFNLCKDCRDSLHEWMEGKEDV